MDQAKIGKFIAENRTAKDITQEELATKIGVTDKAISKWENGRCLPDVSLFKPLCKELDISINELLNGEKDKKEHNEDGYINYVKDNNKKHKKKNITITIVSLIIIVILILGIYFINNFGKTIIYTLSGESKNFSYTEGLLTISNDKYILSTGTIKIINNEIKTEKILSVRTMYKNEVIASDFYKSGNLILIEDVGYNEIFTKEKINNLDEWIIEIIYFQEDEIKEEKIKIKNEIVIKTNKFFSKKSTPIGRDKLQNNKQQESEEDIINPIEYRDILLKEGFKKTNNSMVIEKKINGALYQVDWYSKQIKYSYKDEEGNYIWAVYIPTIYSIKFYGTYNNKSYVYSLDTETKDVTCIEKEDVCPPNRWQEAQETYLVFKEILNKK